MNKGTEITNLQYAMQIHQNIVINGGIAANALCEMCRNLKIMRDEKLYETLGYEDFDTYSVKMANIKARQAYTYISTFESLGESVLQSTANLGITKLSLIAQLPPSDRADAVENVDEIAGMTVAQVKELVAKSKHQGEQLSLVIDERDKLTLEIDTKDVELFQLNERLKDAMQAINDQPIIYSEEFGEAVKAAKSEAEKEYRQKLKDLEEKRKKDINYAEGVAEKRGKVMGANEAEAEIKAEYEAKIKQLEAAADEAKAEAEAVSKRLGLSDSDITTVKIYLQNTLDMYRQCVEFIGKMEGDARTKCITAVNKMASIIKAEAEGLKEHDGR